MSDLRLNAFTLPVDHTKLPAATASFSNRASAARMGRRLIRGTDIGVRVLIQE